MSKFFFFFFLKSHDCHDVLRISYMQLVYLQVGVYALCSTYFLYLKQVCNVNCFAIFGISYFITNYDINIFFITIVLQCYMLILIFFHQIHKSLKPKGKLVITPSESF